MLRVPLCGAGCPACDSSVTDEMRTEALYRLDSLHRQDQGRVAGQTASPGVCFCGTEDCGRSGKLAFEYGAEGGSMEASGERRPASISLSSGVAGIRRILTALVEVHPRQDTEVNDSLGAGLFPIRRVQTCKHSRPTGDSMT